MAFIDTAQVTVKAGRGGDGLVSFRREKFVERGGPDGGDGGDGGSVIFKATQNLNTLAHFRHNQLLQADSGESGGRQKRHGKKGQDLLVELPLGTVVKDQTEIVADLTELDKPVVIARGGQGGFGNAHFTSSRRQAPRVAEKGEPGDSFELTLELKMIADVGIIGLPNAGKSSLLSVISNARPEIADYPFTTLVPNLGVVDVGKRSLLFADIPGLIEGAAEGKGLGDDFLRHVERTAVLIHVIDIYQKDIADAYCVISKELKKYQLDVAKKPQIIALNKAEGLDKKTTSERVAEVRQIVPKNQSIFVISTQAKSGLKELIAEAAKQVATIRHRQAENSEAEEDIVYRLESTDSWNITKTAGGFKVSGSKIEKFARRTDFQNDFGVRRLKDIMFKMGIMHELEKQGLAKGDEVTFRGIKDSISF